VLELEEVELDELVGVDLSELVADAGGVLAAGVAEVAALRESVR